MPSWLFWWRPPCVLRAVIVNLKDDPTTAIKGVLWSSRGAWLTVREPFLLKAGMQPARMDGDVIIHRSNVAFLQVVP
jgi:hypothetical protein